MRTITKSELDRYAKYCTKPERNDMEERHRAGLCDLSCPICDAEVQDITAWVIREGIGACPQCGSRRVKVWEYDCGTDPETGYHNAGTRYRCEECKSEGEYDG